MKKFLKTSLAVLMILFGVQNLQAYDFTVSGQILTSASQLPAPGVMAKLHIEQTNIFETTLSGDDGTYSITVTVDDSLQHIYKISVFDACTGHHICKTGAVTPDGAVENFLICDSVPQTCHAGFMFHHNHQSTNPLEIVFHNTSQGFGTIISFAWDFGDGNTSDEKNPTHIFADYGNYDVTLTIVTEGGCTDSKTKTVAIVQHTMPCEAEFVAHQSHHTALLVHFIDKSHFQPGTWMWEFGDGETSADKNPDHTFAAAGEYTVTLTINGADSTCFDSFSKVVNVIEGGGQTGCDAKFVYHRSHHTALLVHFIDKSQFQPGTWMWEFGDGETSTDKNPDHTYYAAGEYTVTLTINGADSTCFDTFSKVVNVVEGGGQTGCEAKFVYHQSHHTALLVHFIDKSQFQPGTWMWEFGDGETSADKNPDHIYAAAGEYTVTLTINGADSTCFDTNSKTVVVIDSSMNCQANFWWHHNHQSGNPLEIKFMNNSYAFGNIIEFAWNFGDGTTSNEENPLHLYTEFGLYNVNLAITTESGCMSDKTFQVWVHDYTSNCMALFVPVIDSINPLQVYFVDYSLGPINSWAWDFGDNETSTEQNPTHIYAEPAVYNASLTVTTNNCTSSFYYEIDLVSGQVLISPGPTTGIAVQHDSDINLYPNPVNNVLHIQLNVNAPVEVKIINLTGQTLINSTSSVIDVSALPKGVYFANIRFEGQNISRKFIK